jgi:hypothetical protein
MPVASPLLRPSQVVVLKFQYKGSRSLRGTFACDFGYPPPPCGGDSGRRRERCSLPPHPALPPPGGKEVKHLLTLRRKAAPWGADSYIRTSVMPEALEKWPVALLERVLPRQRISSRMLQPIIGWLRSILTRPSGCVKAS